MTEDKKAENNICLKSISELLGMKFFIPSYQRGYRWTEQQVKDLLEDIEEFSKKSNPVDFYCLQPLVVKESVENKDDFVNSLPKESDLDKDVLGLTRKAITKHTKWEVIDGQQRLTTLYILLSFLEVKKADLFSLSYETRVGFSDFFNVINNPNEYVNITFDELIKKNANYDNIDFYYILNAFNTIKEWFKSRNLDKNKYENDLLRHVKFIWYESVGEDPIKVFTRLNIGKIGLTNAELIKALFLNQSNFQDHDKVHLRLRQQEIASEWDNIEYTLQNDEFWLFLHENGYNRPTRIDFIFDLICEQQSLGEFTKIGTDERRTFRYFYEYYKEDDLKLGDNQNAESISKIEKCWVKVKKYFQIFQEWFNDLEMYHYVGALLSDDFLKKNRHLSHIVEKWTGSKKEFLDYLKGEITKEIEIPDGKYLCDENNIEESLHFDVDKKLIRKILLTYNIQTVINHNQQLKENDGYQLPVFYKFPFHLFKREVWNVEHIDSNTNNELTELKQQKEWLLAAWIVVSKKLREEIQKFIQNDSSDNFMTLYNKVFKEIGKEQNKLNESERMRIWNLALLDESTNKGYHNDIFPLKRRCLIGRDQGVIINSEIVKEKDSIVIKLTKKPAEISFIPICTKNAFLKYYTPSTNNLMDWDKTDAINYKQNILDTLKVFGITELSNNQDKENNEQ